MHPRQDDGDLHLIRNAQGVSGASTVTMQLARLVVPAKKRTLAAKLNEARNALRIERRLSKNEILELYLNTLPFGFQTEGITSAAKTFFAAPLEELSIEQLCCLAVIPRRPSGNNPLEHPEVCAERACELYRSLGNSSAASGHGASIGAAPLEHFVRIAENARRAEYPFYLPHCVDFLKKRFAREGRSLPPEIRLTNAAFIHIFADRASFRDIYGI